MTYIIQTQRDRKVEEIFYDHNNEHLHDEFSPGQLNYRKREITIKKYYRMFLVFYIVLYFVMLFPFFFVLWDRWAI